MVQLKNLHTTGNQRRLPLTCQSSWTASISLHLASPTPPGLAAETEGGEGGGGGGGGNSSRKKQVLNLPPPPSLLTLISVQPANSQTKSYLCIVTDLEEPQVPGPRTSRSVLPHPLAHWPTPSHPLGPSSPAPVGWVRLGHIATSRWGSYHHSVRSPFSCTQGHVCTSAGTATVSTCSSRGNT